MPLEILEVILPKIPSVLIGIMRFLEKNKILNETKS